MIYKGNVQILRHLLLICLPIARPLMIEAVAQEIPDASMKAALRLGHASIQSAIRLQLSLMTGTLTYDLHMKSPCLQ